MKSFLRGGKTVMKEQPDMNVREAWVDSNQGPASAKDCYLRLKDTNNCNNRGPSTLSSTSSIPIHKHKHPMAPPVTSSICSTDSEMTLTAASDGEDDPRHVSRIPFKNLQYYRFKDTPYPFATVIDDFDKLNTGMPRNPPSNPPAMNANRKMGMHKFHEDNLSPKSSMKIKDKILLHNQLNDAATIIQKNWRGFYTRHRDPTVQGIKCRLQKNRTKEYLRYLLSELSSNQEKMASMHQRSEGQEELIRKMQEQLKVTSPDSMGIAHPASSVATNKTNHELIASRTDPDAMAQMFKVCASLQKQIHDLKDNLAEVSKKIPEDAEAIELSSKQRIQVSSMRSSSAKLNSHHSPKNMKQQVPSSSVVNEESPKTDPVVNGFASNLACNLLTQSLDVLQDRRNPSSPEGSSCKTYNVIDDDDPFPVTEESFDLSDTFLNHLDIESLDAFL